MKKLALVAVLSLVAFIGNAGASTLIGSGISMTMAANGTGYSGGVVGGSNSWGGVLFSSFTATVNQSGYGWLGNLNWYCVDLRNTLGGNSWNVYWTDETLATGASYNYAGTWTGNKRAAALLNRWGWNTTSNIGRAALQLAVWESVYDSGTTADFTAGSFKVTSVSGPDPTGMMSLASSMYNVVAPSDVAIYGDDTQNQMAGVPEPGTLILFGLGLTGIGVVAIRKRR